MRCAFDLLHDAQAVPAARLARALNATLLTEREGSRRPYYPTGGTEYEKTFRGVGFPADYVHFKECKAWYEKMAGVVIRMPNYFATSVDDDVAADFMRRAAYAGRRPVQFEIEFDAVVPHGRRFRGGCLHVNRIRHAAPSVETAQEEEYLFVPYSTFKVISTTWQSNATYRNPRIIHLQACTDNQLECTVCPVAPWC